MGLIGALLVGILSCTARLSGFKLISAPAVAYIELIRSTPLLAPIVLLLFLVCRRLEFILSRNSNRHSRAFTQQWGVYYAEIVRSGVKAVSYGQIEAATASGLTLSQRLLCIILPQALGYTIPPL